MAFVKMLPNAEKKKWIIKEGVEKVPVFKSMNISTKIIENGHLKITCGTGSGFLLYDAPINFNKYSKLVVTGYTGTDNLDFGRSKDLGHSLTQTKTIYLSEKSPVTKELLFNNVDLDSKYPTFYLYNYGGGNVYFIVNCWLE